MILCFKCKDTQGLFEGRRAKGWVNIETVAMRKLAMVNRAAVLGDLKNTAAKQPGGVEERPQGPHSIRINDQWRLCFRWTPVGSENVEIVNHH